MRLSEKSLELNVGAEILSTVRRRPGFDKCYLRGLTQAEEKAEGVDCFLNLSPNTKLLAFQFKAPKANRDIPPYRFTINREQHDRLYALAALWPGSVFYVFPHYATAAKLQRDLPLLAQDTWLLDVGGMDPNAVFGAAKTRTVRCANGVARINPEYELEPLKALHLQDETGVPAAQFAVWYQKVWKHHDSPSRRRSPAIARGTRVAIIPAASEPA